MEQYYIAYALYSQVTLGHADPAKDPDFMAFRAGMLIHLDPASTYGPHGGQTVMNVSQTMLLDEYRADKYNIKKSLDPGPAVGLLRFGYNRRITDAKDITSRLCFGAFTDETESETDCGIHMPDSEPLSGISLNLRHSRTAAIDVEEEEVQNAAELSSNLFKKQLLRYLNGRAHPDHPIIKERLAVDSAARGLDGSDDGISNQVLRAARFLETITGSDLLPHEPDVFTAPKPHEVDGYLKVSPLHYNS